MSNQLQELFWEENSCKESLTECSECRGERVIKETFYLLRICKKCNGVGMLDWIDNAIGDSKLRADKGRDFENPITRSNISHLISLITEEYARFGVMIDIKIEHIDQHHRHSDEYTRRLEYERSLLNPVIISRMKKLMGDT